MKQYIVDRHTDPSNPSLVPVPSERIPVYDTKAEMESDLANLGENEFVMTKDTGEELSDPVNVVEEGNLNAVTSNAVAQLLKKYEFSGITNSIGELEITTELPINAVPICAMSKVGGNIQMIPVAYDISGTKTYYIQVWNDSTNAVRKNFACQGILYYLLDYSLQ